MSLSRSDEILNMPAVFAPDRNCILSGLAGVPRLMNENPAAGNSLLDDPTGTSAECVSSLQSADLDGEHDGCVGCTRTHDSAHPLISVLTNVNGFWKQQSLMDAPSPSEFDFDRNPVYLSPPSTMSDSGSEEPARKPQPFLNTELSSSSEEECDHQRSNSPDGAAKSSFKSSRTNRQDYHTQRGTAKSSLAAYIKQRMDRAKLYKRPKGRPPLNRVGHVADTRKPWAVGELVWARPGRPDPLPWWPAIVVQRPRKPTLPAKSLPRSKDRIDASAVVPEFRVCLLGPIKSFNFRVLPQTRLRLFAGREEFDSFLRESVMQAEDKVKALRQFVIHPNLQSAWHLARDSADAARLAKPDPAGRLSLFPWTSEAKFRLLSGALSHLQPKQNLRATVQPKKRVRQTDDNTSSSDISSDSSSSHKDSDVKSSDRVGKIKPSKDQRRTPDTEVLAKKPLGFSLQELASRFEFEKLRFIHVVPRRVFVCSVCGNAGEHNASSGVKESNASQADPPALKPKRVVDDGLGHAVPDSTDTHYPDIQPCAGGCGNYVHPGCAQSVERAHTHKLKAPSLSNDTAQHAAEETGPADQHPTEGLNPPLTERADEPQASQTSYACSLCLSGLRQCYICNFTHPCPQIFINHTIPGAEASTLLPPKTDNEQSPDSAPLTSTEVPGEADCNPPVAEETQSVAVPAEADKPDTTQRDQLIRCSVKSCRRWYHPSCLRKPPFVAVVRDRRSGTFSCPAHACLACAVETPGTLPRPSPRYIRCFLCPAAYHPGEWCLPAGSKEIAPNWIICPRHALDGSLFQQLPEPLRIPLPSSTLATMFQPTNVSWCFICSKGGRIICCETCPASFHEECLKIDEVPDKFVCEDCANGRHPRYGEIVWSRLPPTLNSRPHRGFKPVTESGENVHTVEDYASLTAGMYWWPGEIVHPRHLLPRSEAKDEIRPDLFVHQAVDEINQLIFDKPENPLGLFPIRLFGLTTRCANQRVLPIVLWSTRARLFPYEEGDDKRGSDSSDSSSSGDDDSQVDHPLRRRHRSSCQDDGEDEDPLLQLRKSIDKENQPTPEKEGDARSSLGSPKSPGIPDLRSRSARRQRLGPQKTTIEVKRKSRHSAITDPALLAQRKAVYGAAVKQAADGWTERREKFDQLLGRSRRPDYYQPIKVNWPLGSVRIYRLSDPSEAPRCECKPNADVEPCGPSSNCINRELHYECLPSVCPNGEACENQRFTKRLYPAQRPFWTGDQRGWGLKTLVPIRSGDFVNEYIGDLIDEEEANRRLRFAHENNVTNYYMMKLDSQRIIDAGPKGNLSRFMNHSCDPNLNTQKWTVNGDNRIGLFAVRDIAAGEELTFDYNFVALGQERLNCRCGAPNCAGFLGASTPAQPSTANSHGHVSQRNTEDRADSHKPTQDQATNGAAKAAAPSGTGPTRGTTLRENVLVREERHEQICYRCGRTQPPQKSAFFNRGHVSKSNENVHENSVAPGKRGLERELKDLVADSMNSSPIKDGQTRAVKRHGLGESSTNSLTALNNETGEDVTLLGVNRLIYCTKPDCPKVYHLSCLDLESAPHGRWFCPWHHCDACGRPSHVFCGLCPSSFCLAHVEGSIAVLPPVQSKMRGRSAKSQTGTSDKPNQRIPVGKNATWQNLLARIVCMSHSDLIQTSQQQAVPDQNSAPAVEDRTQGSLTDSTRRQSPKLTRRRSVRGTSQKSIRQFRSVASRRALLHSSRHRVGSRGRMKRAVYGLKARAKSAGGRSGHGRASHNAVS